MAKVFGKNLTKKDLLEMTKMFSDLKKTDIRMAVILRKISKDIFNKHRKEMLIDDSCSNDFIEDLYIGKLESLREHIRREILSNKKNFKNLDIPKEHKSKKDLKRIEIDFPWSLAFDEEYTD